MARDHHQADSGRLLSAHLSGIAFRYARWGGLTEAEKASGAAELREVAGDCGDLLAEVAGLALGSANSRSPEYEARGQAVAELCRMAGADEALIPSGSRRAAETDPALRELAEQLATQRANTAALIIDGIRDRADLREGITRRYAIDQVWLLTDPAVYHHLTRYRGWSAANYEKWFTGTITRLLLD